MGDLISRSALLTDIMTLPHSEFIMYSDDVKQIIADAPAVDAEPVITGETSDGYHTFNELYHHRAVLFSVIVKAFHDKAWKSRQHHDGTMYDGMFIVGIDTPDGQASYHYDIDPYWEMFDCKELERAPEWDGHTSSDAIERIGTLRKAVPSVEKQYQNQKDATYMSEFEFRGAVFTEHDLPPEAKAIYDALCRDMSEA